MARSARKLALSRKARSLSHHDEVAHAGRDVGHESERAAEQLVRHLEGHLLAVKVRRVVRRRGDRGLGWVDGVLQGLARLLAGLVGWGEVDERERGMS